MVNPENPQDLQKQLQEYKQAISEEFRVSMESEPDEALKHTRDYFKKQMDFAAGQISFLAEFAESEAIKFQACKYIIEQGSKDAERDGDPVKDLLRRLSKNRPSGTSTTAS